MSFQTDLVTDAATFLADFGESVTYTPFGGAPKVITAIIDRQPFTADREGGELVRANLVEIWIATDATTGIATVTEGLDTVSLKMSLDDASPVTFAVQKLFGDSDKGMWHLGCAK